MIGRHRRPHLLYTILIAQLLFVVQIQAEGSRYKLAQQIPVYANKVGPYRNPSETYDYTTLPFCEPTGGAKVIPQALGDALEGDRLVSTPYSVAFQIPVEQNVICEKNYDKAQLDVLRRAISEGYYIQFYVDDLPVYKLVGDALTLKGEGKASKLYLYTHTEFIIQYNGDRVISVDMQTDARTKVDISSLDSTSVTYYYSVQWKQTDTTYQDRQAKYTKAMLEKQRLKVHWFSIMNSVVTVLLLTGFLATIMMRVLRNDFLKFSTDAELGEEAEETGWKYVHADVFRFPSHISWFAALLGTGTQTLVICTLLFGLNLIDYFLPHRRGAFIGTALLVQAFTAGIAGYVSGHYYKMFGGHNWALNALQTIALFHAPIMAVQLFSYVIAWAYGSTAAFSFGHLFLVLLLVVFISWPLTIVGAMNAKRRPVVFQAPCRTTKYPREIPALPWYRSMPAQMFIAGCLPFSAIYIELHFILVSVWGFRQLAIYTILAIVFAILILVTAAITITLTYFQLAAEDHRWWWRSFLCGGSVGIFVYGYCVFHYFASNMSGLMQTTFFLGNTLLMSYLFFIMLGTVGFHAALVFVCYIYRSIKAE